jgi:hypothetical protein
MAEKRNPGSMSRDFFMLSNIFFHYNDPIILDGSTI